MKTKTKMKMKTKMNFGFCFHFTFHFRFGFCFCLPKVFAFLLNPRGLEVPQTVSSLLLGLEVPLHSHLRIFHVAQWCHRWSTLSRLVQKCHGTQKYSTQPNSNVQNSVMLLAFFVFDWKYPFWANLVQKVKIISLS